MSNFRAEKHRKWQGAEKCWKIVFKFHKVQCFPAKSQDWALIFLEKHRFGSVWFILINSNIFFVASAVPEVNHLQKQEVQMQTIIVEKFPNGLLKADRTISDITKVYKYVWTSSVNGSFLHPSTKLTGFWSKEAIPAMILFSSALYFAQTQAAFLISG